jgi:hypothetical protein
MSGEYIASPRDWVREQVERYEASDGTEATTLRDTGLPVVIVTNTGNKTGAIRKTPLMRVKDDSNYVLIGSVGGAPNNPVWFQPSSKSCRNHDKQDVAHACLRGSGSRLNVPTVGYAVQAYPPGEEYRQRTTE